MSTAHPPVLRLLAFLLVWLLLPLQAQASPHTSVFITDERLALLRDDIANHFEPTFRGWQALQQAAEVDLNHAVLAPETLSVTSGADAKVIFSLTDDGRVAYEEALAYRITGDARYGKAARRVLVGWASTVQSVGGEDRTKLAVSRYFPVFIFAADLMRQTALWQASDEAAFAQMLRSRILPASTSRWRFDGLQEAPGVGKNHATWGVLLDASAGAYLDDRVLLGVARRRWQELMDAQIASDGALPTELDATRKKGKTVTAMWYTHLTLWAATLSAEVLSNNGLDVYDTEAGQRLHSAFDRTVDWTINPSHFPLSASRSKVGSDDFAYFMILNRHFPNPDAEWLLRHRHYRPEEPAPFLTFTHGAR